MRFWVSLSLVGLAVASPAVQQERDDSSQPFLNLFQATDVQDQVCSLSL